MFSFEVLREGEREREKEKKRKEKGNLSELLKKEKEKTTQQQKKNRKRKKKCVFCVSPERWYVLLKLSSDLLRLSFSSDHKQKKKKQNKKKQTKKKTNLGTLLMECLHFLLLWSPPSSS